MITVFRDLLAKGLVYGLGASLNGLAGFILIPFFIHHLSAAEYGHFALAEMLINLLLVMLGMGMNVALLARYPRVVDEIERRELVGSLFTILLLVALGIEGIYLSLSLVGLPVLPGLQTEMLFLVVAISATEMIWVLFATLFRAQGAAWRFITVSVAKLVCGLLATVWLIVQFGMHEEGILYGRLAGNALMLVLLLPQLWRYRPRLNLRPALDLVRIGLPLVPATFATMWVSMSPRYFIEWFGDSADVGVFAMSSKIAAIMTLLFVSPFAMAWMVALFRVYQREDAGEIYARILTYYVLIGGTLALALGSGAHVIVQVLGRQDFPLSSGIITVIALANLSCGLMYPLNIGPYVREATQKVLPSFLTATLLSIILGVTMTGLWGVIGASWSQLMVYLALAVFLARLSQRLYPVCYEWKRLGKAIGSLGGAYAAQRLLLTNFNFSPAWGPLIFLLLAAILLVASRFLDAREKQALTLFFRRAGSLT